MHTLIVFRNPNVEERTSDVLNPVLQGLVNLQGAAEALLCLLMISQFAVHHPYATK